jgi:hypothetical protein
MATSLVQQSNNTLAIWLAQLEKDAIILSNMREQEIALVHKTNRAIYNMNHIILKNYWDDMTGPSYDTCRALSSEMSSLVYETRICTFQWKQTFDDAVKNITLYKKELQNCTNEKMVANILKETTYHYNRANKAIKDGINDLDRANSNATLFFNKMATIETEIQRRLDVKKNTDFPPLGRR